MSVQSPRKVDFSKVDEIIKEFDSSKSNLIAILQKVQEVYRYLPEEAMTYIGTKIEGLSPATVYGVATFYAQFSLEPKGKYEIKACDGTACHVRGSMPVLNAIKAKLNTVNEIDSYADKTSIRLNNNDEYLISPDFQADIEAIVVNVKSSSQAGRRLAFIPKSNGDFNASNAKYCQFSPSKNTYERQIITDFSNCACFKIAFTESDGSSTGWGISYLAVITKDPPILKTPESITIDHIKSSRATVHWINSTLAFSNVGMVST